MTTLQKANTRAEHAILEILESGDHFWFKLPPRIGGAVVDVWFNDDEAEMAEKLVLELSTKAVNAKLSHGVALSSTGGQWIMVALEVVGGISSVVTIAEALSPGCIARLHALRGRRVDAHPSLLCQIRVRDWLDERYGAGAWAYDPDAVQASDLGPTTLFHIIETRSDTEHLLAIKGLAGDIREIPFSLRHPTQES